MDYYYYYYYYYMKAFYNGLKEFCMVTHPLCSTMNTRMFIVNILEEKLGMPFRVERTKSVIHLTTVKQ